MNQWNRIENLEIDSYEYGQLILTKMQKEINDRMAIKKITANLGKDVERLEPSYTADENVQW